MINHTSKFKQLKYTIFISFLLESAVLGIRVVGLVMYNNFAIIIESIHILIDLIITIFVIITLFIIDSSSSKKHAYGLYKLEDLVSLIIAFVIGYTGVELLLTALKITIVANPLISGILQVMSIIPLYVAGRYKYSVSLRLKSPSLKADSMHTYTDVYEGAGVAAGLVLQYYSHIIYFYYFSILLASLTLFYVAYSVGKNSILGLLDLPKDKTTIKKITDIVATEPKVREVSSIKARWAGPVIFVELIIKMDPTLEIDEAHKYTEKIEARVKAAIEGIIRITIHIEPIEREMFRVLVPVKSKDLHSELDEKFARAKYFAILDIADAISEIKFIENTYRDSKDKPIAPEILDLFLTLKITDIITKNVGELVFSLLLLRKIYCWKAEYNTLSDNINAFKNKKLSKMSDFTVKRESVSKNISKIKT